MFNITIGYYINFMNHRINNDLSQSTRVSMMILRWLLTNISLFLSNLALFSMYKPGG